MAHSKPAAPTGAVNPAPRQAPVPLLAPKPGYAASVAALGMPQPSLSPNAAPQLPQFPSRINPSLAHPHQQGAPRMPAAVARPRPPPLAPISVPSTPHPLPPTMTPILPVFVRPAQPSPGNEVKWGPEPIMRGNSEEKLIPRRGEQGDDFWRRFSMVAKEENKKRHSQRLRWVTVDLFMMSLHIIPINLPRQPLASRNPERYQSYGWVGLGRRAHPFRRKFRFGPPSAIHHLMTEIIVCWFRNRVRRVYVS